MWGPTFVASTTQPNKSKAGSCRRHRRCRARKLLSLAYWEDDGRTMPPAWRTPSASVHARGGDASISRGGTPDAG
jgi:hypothetical protein